MLPHPLLLLASCLAPLLLPASCNISYRHSEHSYYSESEYSLDGDSWKQRSVNTGLLIMQ